MKNMVVRAVFRIISSYKEKSSDWFFSCMYGVQDATFRLVYFKIDNIDDNNI